MGERERESGQGELGGRDGERGERGRMGKGEEAMKEGVVRVVKVHGPGACFITLSTPTCCEQ